LHSLLENTCGAAAPFPSSVTPLWTLGCAEKIAVVIGSRRVLLQEIKEFSRGEKQRTGTVSRWGGRQEI